MHIWLAASVPSKHFGGVIRNQLGFAAGLENRGHTITTIFNDSPGFAGHPFVFPFRLCARLLFSRKRPDWIIARSFDGVFCAVVCRVFCLSTRTVLQNHGWEEYVYEIEHGLPANIEKMPRTTWKSKLVRFPLLRLMLRACTLCVNGTVSEIRWVQTKYPHCCGKMRYVPNGVQVRECPFWERQTSWPLNFLSVGWFSWKKNLEQTLDVFNAVHRRFPEARLYIIGTGIHGVPEQVALRKMETCVFNVGDEGFEAMDTWYSRCPFLISSSRYEGGHSLAIMEAMSFGMVVFVSRIPQTTEFVRDGWNGVLLDGCDTGADVERILPFITDKNGCIEMRCRAYATAMRNRWQRQVQRLARIIEQKT